MIYPIYIYIYILYLINPQNLSKYVILDEMKFQSKLFCMFTHFNPLHVAPGRQPGSENAPYFRLRGPGFCTVTIYHWYFQYLQGNVCELPPNCVGEHSDDILLPVYVECTPALLVGGGGY